MKTDNLRKLSCVSLSCSLPPSPATLPPSFSVLLFVPIAKDYNFKNWTDFSRAMRNVHVHMDFSTRTLPVFGFLFASNSEAVQSYAYIYPYIHPSIHPCIHSPSPYCNLFERLRTGQRGWFVFHTVRWLFDEVCVPFIWMVFMVPLLFRERLWES